MLTKEQIVVAATQMNNGQPLPEKFLALVDFQLKIQHRIGPQAWSFNDIIFIMKEAGMTKPLAADPKVVPKLKRVAKDRDWAKIQPGEPVDLQSGTTGARYSGVDPTDEACILIKVPDRDAPIKFKKDSDAFVFQNDVDDYEELTQAEIDKRQKKKPVKV